ncbi:hypothetical protein KIN20_013214 [Parelaphostrongylus tenuis]|uniref:Uncharacterized protein n=1 Tax=Parelaphostrongylus tenuis TaxID=148309 RepID=A0AAD5QKW8_PARTN|nr:hypothetical protein KIN20_013214 [Parelaphostrongylus tenuis]
MARLSTCSFLNLLLTIAAVSGCGLMPPGQGITRHFNVSGFSLPVAMVFSTAPNAPTQAPGISPSADAAKALVTRLVMQAVTDVLYQHGRAALLPDAVISMILGQLTIQVNYDPLECKMVFAPKKADDRYPGDRAPEQTCVVIGNTVTSICVKDMDCVINMATKIMPIPSQSISGSITITKIIMANWSRDMWQSVVSRAVRMLTLGSLETHFFSAITTVS